MMNDDKVTELIKTGKHSAALDILYKGYPSVKKFIVTHGGTEEDARDVFQEALVVFCTRAGEPGFTLTARISTYIFSVCRFMWKDQMAAIGKYLPLENDLPLPDIDSMFPEKKQDEYDGLLDKILADIGNNCRKILEAYYFRRMSMQEIAARFGYSSQASAKNQKYKCLEKAKFLAKTEYAVLNQEGARS